MANYSFLRRLKRQTSHVLRSSIRSTRLALTDVTLAELLAEEATRSKPWPPRDTGTLRLISQRSFEVDDFWRVKEILHKRFKKFDGKRWRSSYKALLLAEYLLTHGPLSFADEWQRDREIIERMCRFEHVDEKGYNWGLTVEKQAERVLQLLEKGPFLKEERDRRLRRASRRIHGSDSFRLSFPLALESGSVQDFREWNGRNPVTGGALMANEDGAIVVIRRIHQGEELIPLLSCEEGREIEVLSHQL
ncbi:ENTH domain-containing protein C794.11c-like isoform X2 [Curcuma longa]|uniref:ENTH domain-containing protein C794.11c-like isoform X2 n=1 Tax=Curcuma longa TaxID=136217 RepID=UPI003D9E286A